MDNLGYLVTVLVLAAGVGFLIIDRLTPPFGRFMKRRGVVGVDVHKVEKPEVPEMCGFILALGFAISLILTLILLPQYGVSSAAVLSVVFLNAVIGVTDYFRPLKAHVKIVAAALTSIPLIATGLGVPVWSPYPQLPFIGHLRLTILYPLLFIPLFIALTSNATNMFDIFNGSMVGSTALASIFLIVAATILGRFEAAFLYLLLASCLLAFYRFNRFPSRVFSGDAGSLSIGGALGAIGIVGRLEVVTLVALLPFMINGSLTLSSVGRIFERREVKDRPTLLLPDGRIGASKNSNAPITLTRLLVAPAPLREGEIVKNFFYLTFFSGVLAVLTSVFMVM